MATLLAKSRHANLHKSLEAYITQHIVVGLNVPVMFPRHERIEEVENDTASRWGDVSYIGLDARLGPMNTTRGRLSIGQCILNLNLLELDDHRRLSVAGTHEHSLIELADEVCELFVPGEGIPIYDYFTGGHPQVGAFEVLQQPYPNELPPADRVSQMNISVRLQYMSEVLI